MKFFRRGPDRPETLISCEDETKSITKNTCYIFLPYIYINSSESTSGSRRRRTNRSSNGTKAFRYVLWWENVINIQSSKVICTTSAVWLLIVDMQIHKILSNSLSLNFFSFFKRARSPYASTLITFL